MKLLIILILITFLSGCNSLKKDENINSIKLNNNNKLLNNKEDQETLPLSNIIPEKLDGKNKKKLSNYSIKLDNLNYNSNINNLLNFYGRNLESIDYINIGSQIFRGVLKNDYYYVGIDKNTFKSSKYNVTVFFKDGTKLNSNLKINFNYTEKNINISNITPDTISNKDDTFIILQGNGFKKIISIQLSNNVIIKNTSFKVINDNVASIRIDSGLKPGKYFFNIMHTKGINKLSNIKFNITN